MYYDRNNKNNPNNQPQGNGGNNVHNNEESEVLTLTKALGRAIHKAVVVGTKNMLTEAISSGVTTGAKELTAQLDKNMQQLGESIASNLKELSITAPQPAAPIDVTNMVSGEEYEKMESLLRQTKDRLGEVQRQNLMNEAEAKRLKSVLETKELAIQEKLTMLSKANAENKDLKLQMVDLEGKVRIMRKEAEDNTAKVKLATTEKQDALAAVEALKEQLAAAQQQNQELEVRLNKMSDELAKSQTLEIPVAEAVVATPKAVKAPKAAKAVKAESAPAEVSKPKAPRAAKKPVAKKADKESK